MLLTEEEAREKICPMTEDDSCCASVCMAWRWKEGYEQNPLTGESMLNNKGYCGLAGKVD